LKQTMPAAIVDASERAEILGFFERSHLPAKATLQTLGIHRARFCRWQDRRREAGPEEQADLRSRPHSVWNRIPDESRDKIVELALEAPGLSPRELADDVAATLDLALKASGMVHATVLHRLRLLRGDGSSYAAEGLAKWLDGKSMGHGRRAPLSASLAVSMM
jgi:hypothetical protein